MKKTKNCLTFHYIRRTKSLKYPKKASPLKDLLFVFFVSLLKRFIVPKTIKKMKKEYIYLTINPDNKNVVKVGRTTKKPILRAKEMDRKSHNVNNWIVEKYWEVFDAKIAETIAHYCLQEYSVPSKRELFEIDKEEAIKIIDKNLTVFSCLMSKESIENNYFEQQKYVEKLHTKISELESQITTYQIADTELRAIIDEFRKDLNQPKDKRILA